jgi:GTP1/Obg family GTP-binding protein
MQPFEHLFDTIETTRSLKSTLDDQIRRSSTLIQTLQASSTTIEGLIRNNVKEIQKESIGRMDDKLMELNKRIAALENGKRLIVNPPTIVKSQTDINPKEYHSMLSTLLDRLDKLEGQLES